ncbi:MAG TPA: PQQ-dependent sugar dehydrogenase, partial [Lacunisphaera sp.]|nr:PQQ-dependent sugar dehydrogenase [Lacunisphaera sp.]
SSPIAGVPPVIEKGEGGLMAVAVHPDFARNHWIYLSFSDPGDGTRAMTKIIRARLEGNHLAKQETIFALPKAEYPEGYVLFGSRIVFDGDYLFFSVGERDVKGAAQKLEVPFGKIHRTFHDGTVPLDNPFVAQSGAVGSIWACGIRNPQGLALDPVTHELWEAEHGPRGGDELNLIRKGCNYGWPIITYGMNYDGTPVSEKTEAPGLEQPVRHWTPSIATSQVAVYTGDKFSGWKGNVFVGSLAKQKFIRFEMKAGRVVHEEEIFQNLGRIRDIKTGPDGLLYVALEQLNGAPGWLVRLVPASD